MKIKPSKKTWIILPDLNQTLVVEEGYVFETKQIFFTFTSESEFKEECNRIGISTLTKKDAIKLNREERNKSKNSL